MSALGRKPWRDLRRRPARAILTVVTIAFAVTGLWIFAMPVLMDRAMNDRVAEDRLHDVQLFPADVVLDADELASLRRVPGLAALDVRTLYGTKMLVGDRRVNVLLVGVSDWSDQAVNAISVDQGTAPRAAEVLTDRMNQRSGRYSGALGDDARVADHHGRIHPLRISGRGDTLNYSATVVEDNPVLYADQATVNMLAGARGVSSIEARAVDPTQSAALAVALRDRLLAIEPTVTFDELPDIREGGTWPGEDVFNNFAALLYVGAFLALVSALFLISNTMTTMVAEQSHEVAIMKAIGGRRRQIRRTFVRTALALGAAGTLLGIALGIPFANLALGYIGNQFFGVQPAWGVPTGALLISVVVGMGVTLLASLPALHRASRASVRAGLDAGVNVGGGQLDRALRRVRVPRPTQIGLRNVTRRRTRSLGTMLQIALAVSVALGFLALGVTVADETARTWDSLRWDVIVSQRANVPLDGKAADLIATTPGVAATHPVLYNGLEVDDGEYESWGLPTAQALYEPDLRSGRWLEPADEAQRRKVAVVGTALAATAGVDVGDRLRVGTARGATEVEVIGIDARLMNNGTTLFLPLASFQDMLGRTDTNAYWVVSGDKDKGAIDRLATALEDRLTAAGYPVGTEIHYVEKAANLDGNRILVGVLAIMGIPIVFIGMIGLLNAMTMNVIERTRDVGVLRCIGASARTVRRVFRAEALTVALVGSLVAIPLGWLVGRVLAQVVTNLFHFGSVPYVFPWVSAVFAVLITLALAWLVVIGPLRRASHLPPGEALRYE